MSVSSMRLSYRLIQLFVRALCKLIFGLRIEGAENVPKSGSFILASNHKSLYDPPIIGSSCPRELFFAAKKDLFKIPVFGRLIEHLNSIPIRRDGFDRTALVKLGEALDSGYGIIIFPEGTRSKDNELHTPKPGIGMLTLKHSPQVVPVFVSGSARIKRQILCRQLKIQFGKPFTLAELGLEKLRGKDGYRKVSWVVINRIAELGGVEAPVKQPIAS